MKTISKWSDSFPLQPPLSRATSDEFRLQHLQSNIHRGFNVPCPFCNTNFTSASGAIHHIERGSCRNAPNLNRQTILRMVRERDPNGAITNKQIVWRDEKNVQYSASNLAFSGFLWECYLCHKGFNMKKGLDQHLNSPVHQDKAYRCPNASSICGKTFSTLAALFNHLESESCAFMRFRNVRHQMDNVFARRSIAYVG